MGQEPKNVQDVVALDINLVQSVLQRNKKFFVVWYISRLVHVGRDSVRYVKAQEK